MTPEKIVIIGGSDAGISAGLRVKEFAPDLDVTLFLADEYPNFSICGLPFYLSGEISDWRTLAHRTIREIENEGINIMAGHQVTAVDSDQKQITAVGSGGPSPIIFLRPAYPVFP